jgi:hypothetical protein
LGKAEGTSRTQEGYSQEALWPQANESSYAKEAIGDDEGTVGGEEEGRLVGTDAL